MAVTWRTTEVVEKARAEITIAIASPKLDDDAKRIDVESEIIDVSAKEKVQHHSVIFDALQPNTLYAYRVGSSKHWSPWNQFRTASVQAAPFKFVYFGDPQNSILSLCSRVFRAAYSKAPDASLWHFVGDIVNHGDRDEEWGELFDAFGWVSQVTPMIMLPGNHEYPKYNVEGKKKRILNHLWRPQFTLPDNGPFGLEETVYFVDYQGVRFVMLSCQRPANSRQNRGRRNPGALCLLKVTPPSPGLTRTLRCRRPKPFLDRHLPVRA